MKRHLAALFLAGVVGLGGCSEPTSSPPGDGSAPEPDTAAAPDVELPRGALPGEEAAPVIYEKPQLVYYRINEH